MVTISATGAVTSDNPGGESSQGSAERTSLQLGPHGRPLLGPAHQPGDSSVPSAAATCSAVKSSAAGVTVQGSAQGPGDSSVEHAKQVLRAQGFVFDDDNCDFATPHLTTGTGLHVPCTPQTVGIIGPTLTK